jgi:hypothetical protein
MPFLASFRGLPRPRLSSGMAEERLGEPIAQLEISSCVLSLVVTADAEFIQEIDERRVLQCK